MGVFRELFGERWQRDIGYALYFLCLLFYFTSIVHRWAFIRIHFIFDRCNLSWAASTCAYVNVTNNGPVYCVLIILRRGWNSQLILHSQVRSAFHKSLASHIKYHGWVNCLVPTCWVTSHDHSCIKSGRVYFTCGYLSKQAKVCHFVKMEWVEYRAIKRFSHWKLKAPRIFISVYPLFMARLSHCYTPVISRLWEFRRGREDVKVEHHSHPQITQSPSDDA